MCEQTNVIGVCGGGGILGTCLKSVEARQGDEQRELLDKSTGIRGRSVKRKSFTELTLELSPERQAVSSWQRGWRRLEKLQGSPHLA